MADFIDVGLPTRVDAGPPDGPPVYPDDGYPKIIADQREQYPDPVASVEDVRGYWAAYLERHDRPQPHADPREVVPYISTSRWVADCPECSTGMACWDENPQTCCLVCGRVYKVAWQPPKERARAIRALAARPYRCRIMGSEVDPRSWFPHRGETVERLEVENAVLFGIGQKTANGLTVPDTLKIPDEFADPLAYLDHLKKIES